MPVKPRKNENGIKMKSFPHFLLSLFQPFNNHIDFNYIRHDNKMDAMNK